MSAAWPLVMVSACIYGLAIGGYLSVDYALALDCLPGPKTNAEAFGLWGIAGFCGSTVGPLVGGMLLDWFGKSPEDPSTYTYFGYTLVMLCLGVFMNILVM